MTTLREQLTLAVLALVTDIEGLPNPVRDIDDPRGADYVQVTDGQDDPLHFLSLLDEGVEPRAGCAPVMGAGGVVYDWNLKLVLAYAARTVDATVRKATRDAGVTAISAAILPDPADVSRRQLGALANWFWIESPELHANIFDGEVQLAVARVPITVWFSANDPAA